MGQLFLNIPFEKSSIDENITFQSWNHKTVELEEAARRAKSARMDLIVGHRWLRFDTGD